MKKLSKNQIREIKKQAQDNEVSISSVLIKKDIKKDIKKNTIIFNEEFDRDDSKNNSSIEWNFEVGELLYYKKNKVCLVLEKNEIIPKYTSEKYSFVILVENKKINVVGFTLSLID